MTNSCDFCAESVKRIWQIPDGAHSDAPFWVCIDCHQSYYQEGVPLAKLRETRVI